MSGDNEKEEQAPVNFELRFRQFRHFERQMTLLFKYVGCPLNKKKYIIMVLEMHSIKFSPSCI